MADLADKLSIDDFIKMEKERKEEMTDIRTKLRKEREKVR